MIDNVSVSNQDGSRPDGSRPHGSGRQRYFSNVSMATASTTSTPIFLVPFTHQCNQRWFKSFESLSFGGLASPSLSLSSASFGKDWKIGSCLGSFTDIRPSSPLMQPLLCLCFLCVIYAVFLQAIGAECSLSAWALSQTEQRSSHSILTIECIAHEVPQHMWGSAWSLGERPTNILTPDHDAHCPLLVFSHGFLKHRCGWNGRKTDFSTNTEFCVKMG